MTRSTIAAGLGALLLAGCGGGAGGGGADPYDQALNAFGALEAQIEAEERTVVIPATGSATYDGLAVLDVPGEGDLVGGLTLTAGFLGNSVTGQMADFLNEDGIEIKGSVDIAGGFIDRTAGAGEPQFTATIDGGVEGVDGTEYALSGDVAGSFFGASHEFVDGQIDGWSCVDEACEPLFGSFVGQR